MAVSLCFAVAQVPLDVLDHHDGVVHHAADRDGEGTQGQDVQRVAGGREPDERDQQGQRDGDGRDQGGAYGHQEHQDHGHGEPQAQEALGGEVLDGLLDEGRLVEDRGERGVGAELRLKLGRWRP